MARSSEEIDNRQPNDEYQEHTGLLLRLGDAIYMGLDFLLYGKKLVQSV